MLDNQFYPTPPDMAALMISKIDKTNSLNDVIDPSGGKGDLLDAFHDHWDRHSARKKLYAIEIDRERRATLRGKGYTVIDHDFLAFSGPDKFDLVLMNPPFAEGDKHLLKAFDIVYSGQIICLLNAETIKNPHTRSRQELLKRLDEAGAVIEFHQGAFENAERKTSVEVALVNVMIERKVEEDLFAGCKDAGECEEVVGEKYEVATGKQIEDMVSEYNEILRLSTETIIGYYRNYNKVSKYIGLNRDPEKSYYRTAKDLTALIQGTVNGTVREIRRDFWRKTLDLPEVKGRMTKKRLDEFEALIKDRANLDFTEANIRSFLLNLIAGYDDMLTQAVLEVFHLFTQKHCWEEGGLFSENIHYFDGWKTNKAFKVGKKVIIPVYGGHGNGPFLDWTNRNRWKLDFEVARQLIDIDVVMNYFDGLEQYRSISKALEVAFQCGQNRSIDSTYFTITAYKKGTLHLTFKNEDILRRFNVAACRGKGWLPMDYGTKPYADMSAEEQAVVDTFENGGAAEYEKHLGQPVFEPKWKQKLLLEA